MVAIYCDGADLDRMEALAEDERIEGFTTNPSLMKKAGVTDYHDFAIEVLAATQGKPVSFEVLADDFPTMERQARQIASWGRHVFVKIPVTNCAGKPSYDLIHALSVSGVNVNVTAVFTAEQARHSIDALAGQGIVSVFAGRIADTGVDPRRVLRSARAKITSENVKLLWASAREIYNYRQAEDGYCDIITLSPELIAKLDGFGRDLAEYSLETVRQFSRDSQGITL